MASAKDRAERLTALAHEATAKARDIEKRNGFTAAGRVRTEKELFDLFGEKAVEAFDILMEGKNERTRPKSPAWLALDWL